MDLVCLTKEYRDRNDLFAPEALEEEALCLECSEEVPEGWFDDAPPDERALAGASSGPKPPSEPAFLKFRRPKRVSSVVGPHQRMSQFLPSMPRSGGWQPCTAIIASGKAMASCGATAAVPTPQVTCRDSNEHVLSIR